MRASAAQPAARLRVAVVQMNAGADIDANFRALEPLLARAAAGGAQLALLPENFAFMAADDAARLALAARLEDSAPVAFLREQAQALGMALIGGGLPLAGRAPERARNAAVAVDAAGRVLAVYDKMHLFDAELEGESYRESASTQAGDGPAHVDLAGWRIGLSICYDLRFSWLYRRHARAGCAALAVSAAFTEQTGRAHWEVLLRARAIESRCYVLAAAQTGLHPGGRRTWGHSMIIDPWGEVVAALKRECGVLLADLDPARLAAVRRRLPMREPDDGVMEAAA